MNGSAKLKISYQISANSENPNCLEITGVITPPEDSKLVVISLEVDGIELLPSHRIDFSSNQPNAIPAVKVFNPIPSRLYTFSLIEYLSSGETVKHETTMELQIPPQCMDIPTR